MAQLVTEELARLKSLKTISQPQWSDYEAEKAEPSTIVYRAAANVSGLSENYIAFGNPDSSERPALGLVAEERRGYDPFGKGEAIPTAPVRPIPEDEEEGAVRPPKRRKKS